MLRPEIFKYVQIWKTKKQNVCPVSAATDTHIQIISAGLRRSWQPKAFSELSWWLEASNRLFMLRFHSKTTRQSCLISGTSSFYSGMFDRLGWSWGGPEWRQCSSLVLHRASELGLRSMVLSGTAAAPLCRHVLTLGPKSWCLWPIFLL